MKRSTRFVYMLLGAVLAGAGALAFNALPAATAQDTTTEDVGAHHATASQAPAAAPLSVGDVSDHQAHGILTAAVNKAAEIDTKMDIAIVDAGGNLKAFLRMDGAWLGSIDIAIKKAKTARYFDMNTGDIGGLSQPGGPLFGIEHSNDGLITFPGGIPLKDSEGNVIGAIGVSGSTVENDHAVAQAGADAAN